MLLSLFTLILISVHTLIPRISRLVSERQESTRTDDHGPPTLHPLPSTSSTATSSQRLHHPLKKQSLLPLPNSNVSPRPQTTLRTSLATRPHLPFHPPSRIAFVRPSQPASIVSISSQSQSHPSNLNSQSTSQHPPEVARKVFSPPSSLPLPQTAMGPPSPASSDSSFSDGQLPPLLSYTSPPPSPTLKRSLSPHTLHTLGLPVPVPVPQTISQPRQTHVRLVHDHRVWVIPSRVLSDQSPLFRRMLFGREGMVEVDVRGEEERAWEVMVAALTDR